VVSCQGAKLGKCPPTQGFVQTRENRTEKMGYRRQMCRIKREIWKGGLRQLFIASMGGKSD